MYWGLAVLLLVIARDPSAVDRALERRGLVTLVPRQGFSKAGTVRDNIAFGLKHCEAKLLFADRDVEIVARRFAFEPARIERRIGHRPPHVHLGGVVREDLGTLVADRARAATFAYTSTAFPMLTGTLVTAVAFVPIGFAKSAAGEYTFSIFAVVAIALIALLVGCAAIEGPTPAPGYRPITTLKPPPA